MINDAGQRAEPRLRALKAGRIYISGQTAGHDCMVRSLTQHGAGVELSRPVELGGEIDFYFITENIRVPARIAWQTGKRVGLHFESPLDWLFNQG